MIKMTEEKTVVTRTELALINAVKDRYPETGGMTATGVIDWALRKILTIKMEA